MRALSPLRCDVAHALILDQNFVAITADDLREMSKQVLAAILWHDEPKALCIIEPLNNSGFHSSTPYIAGTARKVS